MVVLGDDVAAVTGDAAIHGQIVPRHGRRQKGEKMLRLDEKLKRIRAGQYRPSDFIIADAKDTDLGSGVTGTGFDRSKPAAPRRRSRREFIDQIKLVVRQNIVDIMLVSASNLELLQEEGAFAGSDVKPAIRANDTTDCWASVRHGVYAGRPSRPFRTASLSRVVTGTATPAPGAPVTGTDLGLYSVTFLNDRDADAAALEAFADFRAEAAANNFKYFYEAFNPNVDCGLSREATGEFPNDCILRSLAGVMRMAGDHWRRGLALAAARRMQYVTWRGNGNGEEAECRGSTSEHDRPTEED